MAAKLMATSPPIEPSARFIWPMPMITSWPSATSMLTAMADSRTKMLNGVRKLGWKNEITATASR